MCSESAGLVLQDVVQEKCLPEVKKWSDIGSLRRQGAKKRGDGFWGQGVLHDPLWLNKGPFREGKAVCDPRLSRSAWSHHVCAVLDPGHWQPIESFLFSFYDTFQLLLLIFYYRSVDGYRGLGDGMCCGLGSKRSAHTSELTSSVHLPAIWRTGSDNQNSLFWIYTATLMIPQMRYHSQRSTPGQYLLQKGPSQSWLNAEGPTS